MAAILGHFSEPGPGEPGDLALPLEAFIGRRFAGARQNWGFARDGAATGPGVFLQSEFDRGVRRSYRDADADPVTWAEVIAGDYDDVYRDHFAGIRDDGRWSGQRGGVPYLYSIHHEQQVDNAEQPNMGVPSEYPVMFARVVGLAREVGATVGTGGPIRFCFVPSIGQFVAGSDGRDEWDVANIAPDPSLYSFVGCDFYNKLTPKGALKRPLWIPELDALHSFALLVGKRWFVGEFGVEENPARPEAKAAYVDAWFAKALSFGVGSRAGSLLGVWVTNKVTPDGDMRPDSSPASAEVFRRWANDPRLAAGLAA